MPTSATSINPAASETTALKPGRRRTALLFFELGVSAFSWPVGTGVLSIIVAGTVAEVVIFVLFLTSNLSFAATSSEA